MARPSGRPPRSIRQDDLGIVAEVHLRLVAGVLAVGLVPTVGTVASVAQVGPVASVAQVGPVAGVRYGPP